MGANSTQTREGSESEILEIGDLEIKTIASEYNMQRKSFVSEPVSIKLQSYVESETGPR